MDNQEEFRWLGSVKRPLRLHSPAELALCKSKADAARLAFMGQDLSQEQVAERIPCSAGQLSHMMRGTRRWTDEAQYRFELITGSLALSQWDAQRRGVDLYVDEKRQRTARLEAELAELRRCA